MSDVNVKGGGFNREKETTSFTEFVKECTRISRFVVGKCIPQIM